MSMGLLCLEFVVSTVALVCPGFLCRRLVMASSEHIIILPTVFDISGVIIMCNERFPKLPYKATPLLIVTVSGYIQTFTCNAKKIKIYSCKGRTMDSTHT